ncbi:hypothetical protein B0T22DRAFT_171581 [Podospora appendiculata]|uniref:Uncharacterized protein n=1 Tax=Podospora appendiculata TaxID=314037 RepID=A0AAE0XB43_9PEZI|nr:hypothetical protein B0T22DRAFT_171581 [Podospora appendiculata]
MVCRDLNCHHPAPQTHPTSQAFPNLRRLFIEARNDNEEREVSRKAVCRFPAPPHPPRKAPAKPDNCSFTTQCSLWGPSQCLA